MEKPYEKAVARVRVPSAIYGAPEVSFSGRLPVVELAQRLNTSHGGQGEGMVNRSSWAATKGGPEFEQTGR